jgi:predicted phosphodiesterase
MTHDAGPRDGRAGRMRRRYPDARVVVYGHSHLPRLDWDEGLMLLNPGSPTDRRRAPQHTMALLRLDGGRAEAEIVQLD